MLDSSTDRRIAPQPTACRVRSRRAFSLIEVMIAALVVTILSLGVLQTLTYSYRANEVIRYRDAARATLVTFSDEFLRLSIATDDGTGTYVMKDLFTVESAATGVGLTWKGVSGTSTGLNVKLGDAGSGQIDAVVTRRIYYLDEDTGVSDGSTATTAAGFMLKGVFTITYTYNGKNYSETFTLARLI